MEYSFSYDNIHFEFSSDKKKMKSSGFFFEGDFMTWEEVIKTEVELQTEVNKNEFKDEDIKKSTFYFLGLLKQMNQYFHMDEMAREQGENFQIT